MGEMRGRPRASTLLLRVRRDQHRRQDGRQRRRVGWEYGEPITLADNGWLGGGVIVCPGVTIGQDTVVRAGAVVTKDLPERVVAAGVPARVLREIGDQDRVEVPRRLT